MDIERIEAFMYFVVLMALIGAIIYMIAQFIINLPFVFLIILFFIVVCYYCFCNFEEHYEDWYW